MMSSSATPYFSVRSRWLRSAISTFRWRVTAMPRCLCSSMQPTTTPAPPDLGRLVEVTADHQLLELAAADDVRALADHHRAAIVLDGEDLDAGDDGAPDGRRAPWPVATRHLGDHADVFGRRAAAAAYDVDPALGAEALELCDHHLGRLVVMPLLVGEACVREARDREARDRGQG